MEWSETKNVSWKVNVPGRGHASPTVVGGRIFLATADEQVKTQSVVCFDRETGKQLWTRKISEGGFPLRINRKNTHASPTVAADGTRLFAAAYHHQAIHVTALDMAGKNLSRAELTGGILNYYNLSGAMMNDEDMRDGVLLKSTAEGGDLTPIVHDEASAGMEKTTLKGADMTRAKLTRANLTKANLVGVVLSEVTISFRSGGGEWRASLKNAKLRGALMNGAVMKNMDMEGADFRETDLRDADLSRSLLIDADFTDADLRGTNLNDTDIWGTKGLPKKFEEDEAD